MTLKNYYGNDAANRAILVAASLAGDDKRQVERSLDELEDLAETCGFHIAARVVQNLNKIDGSTYIGSGKLREIDEAAKVNDVDHLIFDAELSAAQFRNIVELTTAAVHDRTGVILDIFSDHARTDEGKIQVELARLRYSLTRLVGKGKELSRLGGGIGTRGPGETKLEQDRRVIERRMGQLSKELKKMESRRKHQRSARQRRDAIVVAVVGYTNAGKSTLMNRLCGSNIAAGDRLFLTLDPTARQLELRDGIKLVMVDTVGFIREMPEQLQKAFRATLEEVSEADLILHMIDVSDPEAAMHREVVDQQLKELGAGAIETFYILNKMDKKLEASYHDVMMTLRSDRQENIFELSASKGEGIGELREAMAKFAESLMCEFVAEIPYSSSEMEAYIREKGIVDNIDYDNEKIKINGKIQPSKLGPIKEFITRDRKNE